MCPPDLPGGAADGAATSSACTTSGQSAGGLGAALPLGTAAGAAAAAAAAQLVPSLGPGSTSATAAGTGSGGGGPKAQRGPRPRLFRKNACQADDCAADLSACAFYLQASWTCPVCACSCAQCAVSACAYAWAPACHGWSPCVIPRSGLPLLTSPAAPCFPPTAAQPHLPSEFKLVWNGAAAQNAWFSIL